MLHKLSETYNVEVEFRMGVVPVPEFIIEIVSYFYPLEDNNFLDMDLIAADNDYWKFKIVVRDKELDTIIDTYEINSDEYMIFDEKIITNFITKLIEEQNKIINYKT